MITNAAVGICRRVRPSAERSPGRRRGPRWVKRGPWLGAMLGITFTLGACSSTSGDQGGATGETTYTIGYIADTSGAALSTGTPRANAVNLAVEEINSSGYLGAGKKLKLSQTDGASDPTQSITAANGMLADKSVLAVLCCSLSSIAGPLKPIFINSKTALVITTAVLPGLPEPPYIYRTTLLNNEPIGANGSLLTKVIAAYGSKTVDIVRSSDADSMVSEAAAWKQAAETAGATVKVIDTTSKQTDFSGTATQLISDNPDLVVDSMLGSNAPAMVAALKQRGYKGRVVLNEPGGNAQFFKVVGQDIAGALYPSPYAPQSTDPAAVKFTEAYKARFKEDATYDAAQGYLSVYFVAQALKGIQGDVTRDALVTALGKVTSLPSPAGDLTFTNGQAAGGSPIFLQWQADGTQKVWDGKS